VTQVVEGLQVGTRGASKLGVSPSALAYVHTRPTDALVLVDRGGRAEAVPVRARKLRPPPRASRDGTEILVSINEPRATWADIWRIDVASGALRGVTFDSGSVMPIVADVAPSRMVYATSRAGSVSGFEIRMLEGGRRVPETLLAGMTGRAFVDPEALEAWHHGKTTEHEDRFSVRFVELSPRERIVRVVNFESPDPAFAGEMTMVITLEKLARHVESGG